MRLAAQILVTAALTGCYHAAVDTTNLEIER